MWSKCADANFRMTFVVCVSIAKYVAQPLLILPEKRLNIDVIGGCDVEGANIKTVPKGFINSTLFLSWLEFFGNSVPGSVARPLVLVYYGFCIHYNDEIVKKVVEIKIILVLLSSNANYFIKPLCIAFFNHSSRC